MDLDSLKYAELQRLAKEVGLKANMKAEKLLKALKEHFSLQQTSENGNDAGTADDSVPPMDAQNAHTATFVTERRGKGRTAKRKLSDATPVTAQTEEKPTQEAGQSGFKRRRRTSSAKDTLTPVPPEISTKEDAVEKALESGEPNLDSEDAPTEPSVKSVGRRTVGKIPRHEGLMKKKAVLRPTTPNFKKLHEAHFKKMESIDSYVQRKNKQMEVLRNSVKELKTLSEKTLIKPVEKKAQTKVSAGRMSLFSPVVQKKAVPESRRLTQQSANKSALKDSTTFRPTVLTTNKINVRFSQATHDNEYKRSLMKTPARMSPAVPVTSTPGKKSDTHTKLELNKSVGAINKTPVSGVTPFVFNGNNSISVTPGTTKKNAFDLKASLSRPLTYKPHKGKLKPFGAAQENTALNKSQTVPSHQKNYKQHQVQTRDERRAKHTEGRKQKKEKMLGARRGLVMA